MSFLLTMFSTYFNKDMCTFVWFCSKGQLDIAEEARLNSCRKQIRVVGHKNLRFSFYKCRVYAEGLG